MLKIKALQPADMPGALRLSTQAGWNQLEADWQRLLELFPGQCLGGWISEQLIATGTLATYGTALGWVGMILVDENHRHRGYGGAMFDAILSLARERNIRTLGLSATEFGQPVYAKRGFVPADRINRWLGRAYVADESAAVTPTESDWPAMLALDRSATGLDRSSLLRRLAADPSGHVRVVREADYIAGFGLARPGRTAAYVGPIVAKSAAIATSLLDALAAAIHRDCGPIATLIDVTGGNLIEDRLGHAGFVISRPLIRMILPPPAPAFFTTHQVFAATAFETG